MIPGLPEYRQIELYSKKKSLPMDQDEAGELAAAEAAVAALARLFATTHARLAAPGSAMDAPATWRTYLALPRDSGVDKLVAEVYRALRIFHVANTHRSGTVEVRNGLIKASATVDYTSLAVRVTRAGIGLLEAFMAYCCAEATAIYPAAYVEAMLCAYWSDIVAEIRWYYDEDRVLFQYRNKYRMNRHCRFDCDNPRYSMADGQLRFDIGGAYADPIRYPIDFFVVADDHMHIVPVESLTRGGLPLDQLPRWQARLADGLTLPASFRPRFTRETMVPGIPMT